ncbi:hypothetical protein KC723_00880 [Candidatus Kaiserbacteria bacterium]|nr:hypothetical protein [Candidatus Kaiserbacteria bacterium]
MHRYLTIEKNIGETPLEAAERLRVTYPEISDLPLAYAGRLDPMASGKLLVLIGDECKNQTSYHSLDKEYIFEVLLGIKSDTGDVLGILDAEVDSSNISLTDAKRAAQKCVGKIELPYPHFSSKTVEGKPLHTWTMEGRINEIKIPTKTSTVYKLDVLNLRTETRENIYKYATEKIETIPPVTEQRKALGNDFRRADVRVCWKNFIESGQLEDAFSIITLKCIASSGTYMRSLAEVLADHLNTTGLAYSIERTIIGKYKKFPLINFWIKKF